jgi:hypothetical protein
VLPSCIIKYTDLNKTTAVHTAGSANRLITITKTTTIIIIANLKTKTHQKLK